MEHNFLFLPLFLFFFIHMETKTLDKPVSPFLFLCWLPHGFSALLGPPEMGSQWACVLFYLLRLLLLLASFLWLPCSSSVVTNCGLPSMHHPWMGHGKAERAATSPHYSVRRWEAMFGGTSLSPRYWAWTRTCLLTPVPFPQWHYITVSRDYWDILSILCSP